MTSVMNVDWRKLPNAPQAGTRLCSMQELVPSEIKELSFINAQSAEPAFKVILHRFQDHVNAFVNQCPHHWLAMNRSDGKFLMWSEYELMCTHHSAVFNLIKSGECIMGPCQGSNLIRVPIEIIDGQIQITA